MFAVMLKSTWPGTFHRSVRDKAGKIIETLSFAKDQPQLLTKDELEAVKGDIGISLVYAHVDSDGVPMPKAAADQSGPMLPKSRRKKEEAPAE